MNAQEKLKIELQLIEYFNQFENKAIPSIRFKYEKWKEWFRDKKSIYFPKPEKDIEYYTDLLWKFYLKILKQIKLKTTDKGLLKHRIKCEINTFLIDYKLILDNPEFIIVKYWCHFLMEKYEEME